MAVNKPYGDNARVGAVKDRSQVYNPKTDKWVKRDSQTGKFMDVKTTDNKPFKGVRKEKKSSYNKCIASRNDGYALILSINL